MNKKRRRPGSAIFAIMLIIALGNFSRLKGTENIRAIEFVSIFSIGALSGLLIFSIVSDLKKRNDPENKM